MSDLLHPNFEGRVMTDVRVLELVLSACIAVLLMAFTVAVLTVDDLLMVYTLLGTAGLLICRALIGLWKDAP